MAPISQKPLALKSVRPNVMEVEYGAFRGYVDVIDHSQQTPMCKTHFCRTVWPSRDMAEQQAMELARSLQRARVPGASRAMLLTAGLSDATAGRKPLEFVPVSLVKQQPTMPVAKRHLRLVA
ncbi:MAG: hypothetical protein ACN6PJ_10375 [Achromobacter sp.]|uniref:hypothetical protein n=1 Tax=Achromobacter sp. TaxID=134375 RepID=UPI003D0921B6